MIFTCLKCLGREGEGEGGGGEAALPAGAKHPRRVLQAQARGGTCAHQVPGGVQGRRASAQDHLPTDSLAPAQRQPEEDQRGLLRA